MHLGIKLLIESNFSKHSKLKALFKIMKRKVLYYISLVLTTIIAIWMFSTPLDEIKQPIAKKTQELIANQTVSPERLFINSWRTIKKQYVDPKMNGQDWSRWENRYLPYIETNEDVSVAVNSMLQSLNDPYSKFMNITEYESQNINIESNVTGIGINVMSIANKIIISNVIEDSPAQKSGIMIGDIITEIGNTKTDGIPIEDAVKMIRGPKDTFVTLTIDRNNKKQQKNIKRDIVKIKSVNNKILPNNIGYIQVVSFMGMTVPQEFEIAMEKTKETNGLIIDLRGDAGGLLTNAVLIGNMFVNKGNIVSVIYRNGVKANMPAQKTSRFKEKPLIILVNRGTASASEILAGALRDNKKAILIGDRTYGKNSVQQIIPMPNKTGMNLTIAKYLMPNDEDIHGIGIKPDYIVNFTKQDYKNNKDPQLDKAKQVMENLLANKGK